MKEAQRLTKIGNWELDLLNNTLYWSDEIYRIFGCEPQEFGATYESFLNFIHPEDLDYVNSAYQKHITTKEPYNIIHRILVNGEIKYVNERCESEFDSKDQAISSIGTVADITESILIQNALSNAKESAEQGLIFQKSVLEALPDMMFIFDSTYQIIDYHGNGENQLYLSPDLFLNKNIFDVLPQDIAKLTQDKIDSVIATNETEVYKYNLSFNKELHTYEARMVLMDENKTLAIVRDITNVAKL